MTRRAEPEPDLDSINHMSTGRKLRLWWKFRLKQDKADHDKMPCWKQYTVLFIGSVAVGVCTATVTTLMAIIPPLTQFFVVFTFAVSMPLSIIIHFTGRTTIRMLRRRLALRRGRNVEGALTRKELRARGKMKGKQLGARQSFDLAGGARLSANDTGALEAGSAAKAAWRNAAALQKGASAFLGNALIDAAPSLASRQSGIGDKGVMTRNSSAGPRVSTFLDTAVEEAKVGTPRAPGRQSFGAVPKFKPPSATPNKLGSKEKRAAQELALGRGAAILGQNKLSASPFIKSASSTTTDEGKQDDGPITRL